MSERVRLANRRQNRTRRIDWMDPAGNEHPMDVTVGFWEGAFRSSLGQPGEVFISGPREGSTLLHTLEDGCVMASLLCQQGMSFEDIRGHLGRHGSPMGPILNAAAEIVRSAHHEGQKASDTKASIK